MSDDLRSQSRFEEGFWVGEWFIAPMVNRVYHADEDVEVQLEPKVMQVLLCLVDRPGKTITKNQFKETVWEDTVVTDDVLCRCISELRKTFDDDPHDPTYIETIRKTGYRLIADVRVPESTDPTDETEKEKDGSAPLTDDESSPGRVLDRVSPQFQFSSRGDRNSWVAVPDGLSRRKWLLLGAVFLSLIGVVTLFLWLEPGPSTSSESPPSSTPFTSFPGEEFDPALSSSGRQVVFSWRNVDSLFQNIYLMQRGAGRPLQLSADSTVDWSPTWSPDERHVAYAREVRGRHHLYIVSSIGGQGRSVAELEERRIQDVAWSPDTTRSMIVISAQRQPHQAYALTAFNPETDSTVALTTPPPWSTGDTTPAFSPDGSRIAFVRGTVEGIEDIFVMPAAGGEPSQVTTDSTEIYGLAWLKDGNRLLYSARRDEVAGLWSIDAEGGDPDPTLVRMANEGTLFSQPTLSSKNLGYVQEAADLDVWKLSRPNRRTPFQAEPLFSSTQEDTHPSISPNGERVAFVSKRSGTPEVWMAQSSGTGLTKTTSLNGPEIHSIAWSPDGTHLCFVARKEGQTDLFTVPVSGGQASRITRTQAHELVPRWSRDGRWIYYASHRTGMWEVWRRRPDASTKDPQQVTVGGAVAAQESSTRETLYFVRPDTTGIWTVPLDTTRLPLQTGPKRRGLADDSISFPERSPSVLDSTTRDTGAALNGPSPKQVVPEFDPEERHNWWVESEGIYFLHQRRFNAMVLSMYNFRGNDTVPLYTFANLRPGQHVAAGPEGDWFAYTKVDHRESDLMLVENFYSK